MATRELEPNPAGVDIFRLVRIAHTLRGFGWSTTVECFDDGEILFCATTRDKGHIALTSAGVFAETLHLPRDEDGQLIDGYSVHETEGTEEIEASMRLIYSGAPNPKFNDVVSRMIGMAMSSKEDLLAH